MKPPVRLPIPTLWAGSAATQLARPSRQLLQALPPGEPVRHRSRGFALFLAILSVTYLPLSLHNFYLGYYGRGVAAIALLLTGIYLLAVGSLGLIFGPASLSAVGYIGIALLAGWFFWQLSDLFRIISRSLKPKNGEYTPRFL